MQKSVSLKGTKEGYQLLINQEAAFSEVESETEELITQLKKDINPDQVLELTIKTGNRLFTDKEKESILSLIEAKSNFLVKTIESEVVSIDQALKWYKETSTKLEIRTVRSGQIIEAEGDLLLVGGVHPGGTVRATGSIFIIGELKGIAHAGTLGKESAVVVADFRYNAQVRVADHVHVVEQEKDPETLPLSFQVIYLNDLHVLDISSLDKLRKIRPELGKVTGGLA